MAVRLFRPDRQLQIGAVTALVCAFGLVAYGLGAYSAVSSDKAWGVAYIQAAAILAATAGWLYNNAVTIQAKLREKSFEFITIDTADTPVALMRAANNFFRQPSNAQLLADPSAIAELVHNYTYDGRGIVHDLQVACDAFEHIAILIKYNAMDEPIIREYYKGQFLRFFEKYMLFSEALKNLPSWKFYKIDRPSRESLYEHMEWLYTRWAD